jgi:dTDP-4-dehydrorhamnose reductase
MGEMKQRLLVIGSRGFVGAHLAYAAQGRFELVSDAGIDITEASTVRAAFERCDPKVVILAAAISDIDRCQRETERAEAVNVRGAEIVTRECVRTGAKLIFTSTGAVYDGLKHGYVEDEPPTPVSVYGETKVRAERMVADLLPSAAIVRLSLVLGPGLTAGTNSLLDKLAATLRARKPIAVPDEYRNPIDVETLSWFLLALAERPQTSGIYNLGCSESRSRYDLVTNIARQLSVPESLVTLQLEPIAERAPRGRDHFLISTKIENACGARVPSFEQTMERCMNAVTQSRS